MSITKITTPDGDLPSARNPIEGVHYTVVAGTPQHGDMVRDGASFYRLTVRTPPPAPVAGTLGKVTGVTYNEFRSLLTIAELVMIENFERDAYFTELGKTPLTTVQKATVQFLIGEAKATGAPGERGINLASPKMNQGLSDIETMGIIAAGRKAEIQAGVIKS